MLKNPADPAIPPLGNTPSPAKPRRTRTATAERPDRPLLRINSAADAADWLAENGGTGHLAGLFRRNGRIVRCLQVGDGGYRVPEGDDDGSAAVREVSADELAAEIQYTYACRKLMKDAETGAEVLVKAMFPKDSAKLATSAPHKMRALRPLVGVVKVPTVRADGSVLDQPGYDPGSRLLYLPDAGLNVPTVSADPSPAEREAARDLLLEMLEGFAFQTEHDQANTLGFLLTPLLRLIAPPAYKLFAIGAPSPGSGKTLLAHLGRILHGGVFRSEMPHDDAELEKVLGSILTCTSEPVVQFDNVTGTLKSSRLAGLLTSLEYSGRVLGSTNNVDMLNDRVWCVTGNNLSLGGDLVRRTIQITIDPGVPNPENRTGFRHPDLPKWVAEHRGELVAALLTLVRAWVAAGRPARREVGTDSYASWTRVVDGILGHAGIKGTFDHIDSRRVTVGEDDQEWADFLDAVRARFGTESWTAKTMLAAVQMPADGGDEFALRRADVDAEAGRTIPLDALPGNLAERVMRGRAGAGVVAKSLGMWLRNREGRFAVERITVRTAGKDRNKVQLWRIESLEAPQAPGGPETRAEHPQTA